MAKIERREFIKTTATAGVGTLLSPAVLVHAGSDLKVRGEERNCNKSALKKKVIVGGAGISGLSCAYELMKKGHEVVVLEASGR